MGWGISCLQYHSASIHWQGGILRSLISLATSHAHASCVSVVNHQCLSSALALLPPVLWQHISMLIVLLLQAFGCFLRIAIGSPYGPRDSVMAATLVDRAVPIDVIMRSTSVTGQIVSLAVHTKVVDSNIFFSGCPMLVLCWSLLRFLLSIPLYHLLFCEYPVFCQHIRLTCQPPHLYAAGANKGNGLISDVIMFGIDYLA